MTEDFATAMRRALASTRAGDPGGATAIIQSALAARRAGETATGHACDGCAAFVQPGTCPDGTLVRSPRFGMRGAGAMQPPGAFTDMPGLGGLNAAAGRTRRAEQKARTSVPDGAKVEMRSLSGRDVRLFVPSPRTGGPRGLVLMLHGCTQSPEDFALGTRMDRAAEAEGYAVAYPAQTGAHNMQSCWNWFRAQDQTAQGGEPAILASIAHALAAELGVEGRVYAAGLSAGGAMAAILGETHPQLFTALGIHSGLPAGAASDLPSAFAAMRGEGRGRPAAIPAIVFHGTADNTVSPRNARVLVPGDGVETRHRAGARAWTRLTTAAGSELWLIEGAGHAWSGGDANGSHADPQGPDASAEMLRFFGEVAARN